MKHTILGAGGPVGKELAAELTKLQKPVRLVSRNPITGPFGSEWLKADLSNRAEVFAAVEGSEVAYLTIGFPYLTSVWQQNWPTLMKNVTDACISHGVRLVFFDNIYALSKDHINPITEASPINPPSKKGVIRAEVVKILLEAIEKKGLNGLIARSADFITLDENKGLIKPLVYDRLKNGKKGQWICNANVVHNFSYLPDLGKGTAILGTTPEAFQQVWNLPTDTSRITGADWIRLFAHRMHQQQEYSIVSAGMIKFLGLFVPYMREMVEMLYQYSADYYFDSSKFNQHFNYTPKTPQEIVDALLAVKE
jgi:nucleoside-diphosphate-sugar epimerase